MLYFNPHLTLVSSCRMQSIHVAISTPSSYGFCFRLLAFFVEALHEIIEFPVVKLNLETLHTDSVFHTYVLPRVNPVLTQFCTELTGIRQEMIDGKPFLEDALILLIVSGAESLKQLILLLFLHLSLPLVPYAALSSVGLSSESANRSPSLKPSQEGQSIGDQKANQAGFQYLCIPPTQVLMPSEMIRKGNAFEGALPLFGLLLANFVHD
ncbi:unnamed protein product [Protopolystoma xenopodis]|uniref:Exonuclease domain-containing protein n=1 Tax=Protopolystoma xenopodis TaxID=117903 RepID=A0A448XDG7_9PLAT|nr:unnamed protein product [Protopolystoma xenopodis]